MASNPSPFLFLILPYLFFTSPAASFDINKILSQFPDFSTYNVYLTETQLSTQINARQTITVLVVNNAAIASLSSQPPDVVKKLLAVHVILDYYDANKFLQLPNNSAILTTLYQTTGLATNQNGFLNATIRNNGMVAIGSASPGAPLNSNFVKVLVTHPYNISVVQISSLIVPPGIAIGDWAAGSPAQPPSTAAPTLTPANAPGVAAPAWMPVVPWSPSQAPSSCVCIPPTGAVTPWPAPVAYSPGPSDDSWAPPPESGGPVTTSPPSPPNSPAKSPTSSIAGAPGPAAGTVHQESVAGRLVTGKGLAAAIVAASLGVLLGAL